MPSSQVLIQGFAQDFAAQVTRELGPNVEFCVAAGNAGWQSLTTSALALVGPAANVPLRIQGKAEPVVQIIALGLDTDQRRALVEHGRLVYVAPGLPRPVDVAALIRALLNTVDDPASIPKQVGEAESDVLLALGAALARGLQGYPDLGVRLHLAPHRSAPLLAIDIASERLLDNPHGEGLAAYTLRSGRDVCVERLDADRRAAAEVDIGSAFGAERAFFLDAGRRDIGAQTYNVVVALTIPPLADTGAVCHHTRSLLDALCAASQERQLDATWGNAAHLFRAEARRARSRSVDSAYIPQFAPRWARRLGRVWFWSLPILPIALVIPVPEIVQGTAEVIVPDAPLLSAPRAADVRALDVRLGQRVRAGQVLLRLAEPEAESALASAYSDYRALLRQRLEKPASTDDTALGQAWERMQDRLRQRELPVLAPVDGIVAELPVAAGRTVAAGEALALVLPSSTQIILELELPASQRERMRDGQEGSVRLDDARGSDLTIRLDNVSGVVRNSSGRAVLRARAHLLRDDAKPAPGERGKVSLRVGLLPLYKLLWPQWRERTS